MDTIAPETRLPFDIDAQPVVQAAKAIQPTLRRYKDQIEREQAPLRVRGTVAHVMQERPEMASAFLLFRGDYDKRGVKVEPQTPKALPPFPADLSAPDVEVSVTVRFSLMR